MRKHLSLPVNGSIPQTLPTSPHEIRRSYQLLPYAGKHDRNDFLRGWPVRPERRGRWVRKARLLLTNLARCPPPRIWFNHCLPELHGPKSYTKVSIENLWGGLYSTMFSIVLVMPLTRCIQNWSIWPGVLWIQFSWLISFDLMQGIGMIIGFQCQVGIHVAHRVSRIIPWSQHAHGLPQLNDQFMLSY